MKQATSNWAITLVLLLAGAARADLYVNNLHGDDHNDGQTAEALGGGRGPLRTIGRALEVARVAERICVANTGQPYYESLSLSAAAHNGFDNLPFVIEGNGAVLDGSRPVPPTAWQHYRGDVFRFKPVYGQFQQLFLDGKPVARRWASANDEHPPELDPLQWCLHRGFIYFRTAGPALPRDLNLSFAAERTGITLYQVRHVMIVDLVVQGFQIDGVQATNGSRHCRLGGLTLRGNGRAGLAITGDAQLRIDGCLIGDNGLAQVWVADLARLAIETSELLPASAPAINRLGGQITIDGQPHRED